MDHRIVLIVDELKDKIKVANITRNDLEGNSIDQTLRLEKTLTQVAPVVRYTAPGDFECHIQEHLNDIVFPMYYGTACPTSKGIVPSLCEAKNIPYIGADVYAQIICNDKSLSKQYAENFGIFSPKGVLLRNPKDNESTIELINHLPLPLVVKPNFGGGSTGISAKNIVNSYSDAAILAQKLHQYLNIPILVEEYIAGYEVELIVVGSQHSIRFCEEVQLLIGNKDFFDNDLWGFETKDIDDSTIDFQLSHYISELDRQRLLTLFSSFEKMEIIRFDGRIRDGRFYLLELSPDCYLGDDCAFYFAFQSKGYTHSDMFRFIIDNALNLG